MTVSDLATFAAGRRVRRRHSTPTSAEPPLRRVDAGPGHAAITSLPIATDTAVERGPHNATDETAKTSWLSPAGGIGVRPPLADPAMLPAFLARVVEAFPDLRLPGPERFQPEQPDWCICAVTLLWTDDLGWVHFIDRQPCPLPRGTRP